MLDAPAYLSSHLASEDHNPSFPASHPSPLKIAQAFMVEHGDHLATAADLLGGSRWFGRYLRLASNLRRAQITSSQLLRELDAFRGLLMLEHVGDMDRVETELFMQLHPDSEEADQIRRLAETLERFLGELQRTMARAAGEPHASLVAHDAPGSTGETQTPALRNRRWAPGKNGKAHRAAESRSGRSGVA
jgi:hypothetical protein